MRIKNTTLAILWPIIFIGSVALAAAGDRYFSNPTSNKDVVIQVNKAGVTTDVIKAVGSTGTVTVRGRTDGSSPAAGEIGEQKTNLGPETTGTSPGTVTLATLLLTDGLWRVDFYVWSINGTPVSAGTYIISKALLGNSTFGPSTGTSVDNSGVLTIAPNTTNFNGGAASSIPLLVSVTTGTPDKNIYLRSVLSGITSGLAAWRGYIVATRM